jgi:hypothetical protein
MEPFATMQDLSGADLFIGRFPEDANLTGNATPLCGSTVDEPAATCADAGPAQKAKLIMQRRTALQSPSSLNCIDKMDTSTARIRASGSRHLIFSLSPNN